MDLAELETLVAGLVPLCEADDARRAAAASEFTGSLHDYVERSARPLANRLDAVETLVVQRKPGFPIYRFDVLRDQNGRLLEMTATPVGLVNLGGAG